MGEMIPVRIDDYPYGTPPKSLDYCRETVEQVLEIFERNKAPYILGVIPFEITRVDVDMLNRVMECGRAVMHGFDHMFSRWGAYGSVVNSWPLGGEFAGMSAVEIAERYMDADAMMKSLNTYDPTQFIAPFNTYTQALLDVLRFSVERIHTCDKEYDAYEYSKLDHHGIEPVISRWKQEYDFAFRLLPRDLRGRQVTLHWMYDVRQDPEWKTNYQKLCNKLKAG